MFLLRVPTEKIIFSVKGEILFTWKLKLIELKIKKPLGYIDLTKD